MVNAKLYIEKTQWLFCRIYPNSFIGILIKHLLLKVFKERVGETHFFQKGVFPQKNYIVITNHFCACDGERKTSTRTLLSTNDFLDVV